MKFIFILLMLTLSSVAQAAPTDVKPKISKLQFQGIHFGDFPSVDMICIRGLCPVGDVGIGINTNSVVPPSYVKRTAITHYHNVRISTPEYTYFDNQMCQVKFNLKCVKKNQLECIDAVRNGIDAEYGLTLLEKIEADERSTQAGEAYSTESGSTVLIGWDTGKKRNSFPFVKISENTLMDLARTAVNPDYPAYAAKMRAKQAEEAAKKH